MILRRTRALLFIGVMTTLMGCSEKKKTGLANPASQNCIDKGGILQIKKRGDEGEYGVCIFQNNHQCEEWALFHGKCPVGGVSVSGSLTPEEIYCGILGGFVFEDGTVCHLPSGKRCSTLNVYNGKCF